MPESVSVPEDVVNPTVPVEPNEQPEPVQPFPQTPAVAPPPPESPPPGAPAPSAPESSSPRLTEAQINTLPRDEQVSYHQANALRIVGYAKDQGVYAGDPAKSAQAESAISTAGGDIKALLISLKSIEGDPGATEAIMKRVSETYTKISQNVLVQDGGRFYSLSDLQTERSSADPARQAEIDKIINEGTYTKSTEAGVGRTLIGQAVGEQVSLLQAKITELKAQNQDASAQEAFLVRLQGAQSAKGEAGAVFAVGALRALKDSGVQGLDGVLAHGQAIEDQAREAISAHLSGKGLVSSEVASVIEQAEAGDIKGLTENPKLAGAGIDVLIFGKELSDGEVQAEADKILTPEQKKKIIVEWGKKGLLAVLFAALIAAATIGVAKNFES